MREPSFLMEPLTVADEPGLDTLDERFTDITAMVSEKDYAAAAKEIDALFDEDIYDIRLIGYYLFYQFELGGLNALPKLLPALQGMLEKNYDAVGPAARREAFVDKALSWFFREVGNWLEYRQTKGDAEWQRWVEEADPEAMQTAVDACAAITHWLTDENGSETRAPLSGVLTRLREVTSMLKVRGTEEEAAASPEAAAAEALPHRAASRVEGDGATATLRVSSRFRELVAKLEAFEQLVEAGKFEKAALVSDDLLSLVESFDPRSYFPELFATFSRMLSENVAEMEPHWEGRDTVSWKTLDQFYRVDLDAFVEG